MARAIVVLLVIGAATAAAAQQTSAAPTAWWGSKPTDKCTPYNVEGYRSLDSVCAILDGATTAQLDRLYLSAKPPTAGQGFPLRGCTYGCVPGSNGVEAITRLPQTNMGWSGKCFSFQINATTGTPMTLLNAFAPKYEYAVDKQAARVNGTMAGFANVYWEPKSFSDGRPVWTFNYTNSADLFDPSLDDAVEVQSIRDEARLISPGFILGRMYIQTSAKKGVEVPIYFALFQACTANGQYATTPGARALPPLGGLTLPGSTVGLGV
ncbi:hypothetical protein HT031_003579 [Scenedesmus sp. PABB004]|nr:hypothetical protein HT031_003579 [Scenedesmus sp. PABB004]